MIADLKMPGGIKCGELFQVHQENNYRHTGVLGDTTSTSTSAGAVGRLASKKGAFRGDPTRANIFPELQMMLTSRPAALLKLPGGAQLVRIQQGVADFPTITVPFVGDATSKLKKLAGDKAKKWVLASMEGGNANALKAVSNGRRRETGIEGAKLR